MFSVVLTDMGLLTALTGLISLVRPITFLGIRNRSGASAVLVAGVLVAVVATLLPAQETSVGSPRTALDRVAPSYQFHEVHSITIRATPERVYRAIKDVTAGEILFFRTLIKIRYFGRPLPSNIRNSPEDRPLLDVATRATFAMFVDSPLEIVTGTAVMAPPDARKGRPPTADELLALRTRGGVALATMNFAITPGDDGTCVVSTETRVYATDPSARRRFGAYWRIIYPGSALMRRMWLRAIRQRAEAA